MNTIQSNFVKTVQPATMTQKPYIFCLFLHIHPTHHYVFVECFLPIGLCLILHRSQPTHRLRRTLTQFLPSLQKITETIMSNSKLRLLIIKIRIVANIRPSNPAIYAFSSSLLSIASSSIFTCKSRLHSSSSSNASHAAHL